ncbi:MAG TPA: phytanoyl-CoA dioxygenase family protein [Acidimicrobiales bacterium]|nr:phytanoyl-CoA dioxygenase family protein [Acidimicrobiales bacterium]
MKSLDDERAQRLSLRAHLVRWARHGYTTLPGAIDSALIDDFLHDVSEVIDNRSHYHLPVLVEGRGIRPICELDDDDFAIRHLRLMDLHSLSQSGKQIALHADVVWLLGHLFRAPIVAMQTLTFIHGSEQRIHQDAAFVRADGTGQLAATWIALEDALPDAGPLFYVPGSHTLEPFDFGDGSFLTPQSTANELDFADYLTNESVNAGLDEKVFLAGKGDVFFWHAGLAHGGAPTRDVARTRRSLVTHYSTLAAYPRDQRQPHAAVVVQEVNGGFVYEDPTNRAEENILPLRR